jgi:hypothetical protein
MTLIKRGPGGGQESGHIDIDAELNDLLRQAP